MKRLCFLLFIILCETYRAPVFAAHTPDEPEYYTTMCEKFSMENEIDSVVHYYRLLIEHEPQFPLRYIYDATRELFLIHLYAYDDHETAIQYAEQLVDVCDSLGVGNHKAVVEAKPDSVPVVVVHAENGTGERWRGALIALLACAAFSLALPTAGMIRTRKKDAATTDTPKAIHSVRESAPSEEPGDIIGELRLTAAKAHKLTQKEWRALFRAIDAQHPDFAHSLPAILGSVTDRRRQLAYLMKAGLTNSEIRNLTDISHPTIWRFGRDFRERL